MVRTATGHAACRPAPAVVTPGWRSSVVVLLLVAPLLWAAAPAERATAETPSGRAERVLVLGDSVGWSLATGMRVVQAGYGTEVTDRSAIACPIAAVPTRSAGIVTTPDPRCALWQEQWDDAVWSLRPDDVIVSHHSGVADEVWIGGRWEPATCSNPVWTNWYREQAEHWIRVAGAAGATVHVTTSGYTRSFGVQDPGLDAMTDCINGLRREAVARHPHTRIIELGAWTCPTSDTCDVDPSGALKRNDGLHYFDDGHHLAARWVFGELWAGWGAAAFPRGVARNADGRLELFRHGFDGQIWHAWQAPGWPGGWSSFAALPAPVGFRSPPTVIRNGDGRLEAFALGSDGAVWHTWQWVPNGWWSAWSSLGGSFPNPDRLAVGLNAAGRPEVFAAAADGRIHHRWRGAASWGPWTVHGAFGPVAPRGVTVVRSATRQLELLVVDGSGQLLRSTQQDVWSQTWTLGQVVGAGYSGGVSVGHNADGRLEVFGVSGTGSLLHQWQSAPGSAPLGAASVVSAGGWPTGGTDRLAVGHDDDGRIEVFARTGDGRIQFVFQTTPNGLWSTRGGLGWSGVRSDPVVGTNPDGRLEVFALTSPFVMAHDWQRWPGGIWWGGVGLAVGPF